MLSQTLVVTALGNTRTSDNILHSGSNISLSGSASAALIAFDGRLLEGLGGRLITVPSDSAPEGGDSD